MVFHSNLGLIIICYSLLGRGQLLDTSTPSSTFKQGNCRAVLKRFHGDTWAKNPIHFDFLNSIIKNRPKDKRCSLVQLVLGCIKH